MEISSGILYTGTYVILAIEPRLRVCELVKAHAMQRLNPETRLYRPYAY